MSHRHQSTTPTQQRAWAAPSPDAWGIVAADIAKRLNPGSILALSGPLGAGKTTFVQALAAMLGASRNPKSPTFTMLRTYPVDHQGITRLLHLDAYRIENEADLLPLDLDEELREPGTILIIEWPEQMPGWLAKHPHLMLEIGIDGEGRKARLGEGRE